ncbi:MAG: DegT/DnrJ/EryC1/StrS family aminotransferase [Candidatus Cloacimonetes bacterium]|nr:DegT/DnrJ/EryC1/StrS family aminotransferase [Candidatus Cloacimonadota bacterium]
MKVPLLDLHAQYEPIMSEIRKEMDKVFDSHWYILGPSVKEFEQQVETFLNADYAIGCASGTDALILALQALNIGEGDEVITTSFTFFATAGAISRVHAKPIFVDIKQDTFNIDPDLIEDAITPKTKAIMPVHLFGQAAEMDKIMAIAKKYNLKVIEDNAQGIGCLYDGKAAGTIGDIGTLSFFPSKNLGTMGDGGMCLTNDEQLADNMRQLRVHGEKPKYIHKWVGLNSRLDSLHAAVLKVKLNYLSGWSEARRKNAEYYYKNLKDLNEITLPYIHPKAVSIYNQFTIKTEKRDELMKYLSDNGIGCAVYYPLPLHLQECFADLGYKIGDLPVAEEAAKKVLSIPIYSELSEEQMAYVVKTIKAFYNK